MDAKQKSSQPLKGIGLVVQTRDGQSISWDECLSDAEPGVVTCNSHCSGCVKPEFRQACKESRADKL